MKLLLALSMTIALSASATAATNTAREEAINECTAQARTMGYTPRTVKWVNFVKDCMVDRDVNS